MKKKGPIDFIKDLTERKTPWENLSETDKKGFSPYIINLFLSMNPDLIEFVNQTQRFTIGKLTPKMVYKMYLDFLPKMRLPYHKYIKASKATKYNPELLKLIADHHYISQRIAEQYIDIMPRDEIEDIIRMYGKTDKEVKKYFK